MKFKITSLIVLSIASTQVSAGSLQDELDTLALPANTVPEGTSKEKLYSMQTRMNPLARRFELGLNGFSNVSLGDFITSEEVGGSLRYHFSDKWSLGFNGNAVFNSLTSASKSLLDRDGILAKQPYALSMYDLSPRLHTFYGKIRLSMDSTLYFDHYVSLGPSYTRMNTGSFFGGAADTGFVFWSGKKLNFNLGAKFYGSSTKVGEDNGFQINTLMHVGVGYVFGGGS